MLTMLNIVKIMDSVISGGYKVLVHCHAGMGRTGLTIGCYMLYSREYTNVDEVMEIVQKKRAKAFTNKRQRLFVGLFNQLLVELRVLFPSEEKDRVVLDEYLQKQGYLLHGNRRRKLRNCPILVFEVCERVALMHKRRLISEQGVADAIICRSKGDLEAEIQALKSALNKWDWVALYNCDNPVVLVQTMFDFLEGLALPAVDSDRVPTSSSAEKSLLTTAEKELMRALAGLCRILACEAVDCRDQDTAIYRIVLSLLRLRGREAKCFLNRMIIDWDFANADSIERLKEYFDKVMHEEGLLGTPVRETAGHSDKATLESVVSPSVPPSVTTREEHKFSYAQYHELSANMSKLPSEDRLVCFQRFDELMREVEQKSTLPRVRSHVDMLPRSPPPPASSIRTLTEIESNKTREDQPRNKAEIGRASPSTFVS